MVIQIQNILKKYIEYVESIQPLGQSQQSQEKWKCSPCDSIGMNLTIDMGSKICSIPNDGFVQIDG